MSTCEFLEQSLETANKFYVPPKPFGQVINVIVSCKLEGLNTTSGIDTDPLNGTLNFLPGRIIRVGHNFMVQPNHFVGNVWSKDGGTGVEIALIGPTIIQSDDNVSFAILAYDGTPSPINPPNPRNQFWLDDVVCDGVGRTITGIGNGIGGSLEGKYQLTLGPVLHFPVP
ncbi:hypothetical protein [Burkholderia sp. Ac-20365]|uniref:hypothetical protein n=1 Tax=Burkholderia sp. Ac-20365 TaxID=2703897 RepID=UPI00197BF722|nr:hypothetical protein [Burkholderia sp. Ac-20365]MBN3761115.1 hypothetical protein [Burkholderia sp. Ac-20365]